MPLPNNKRKTASSSTFSNVGPICHCIKRRSSNAIRMVLASLLLTVVTTACAQNHDVTAQRPSDTTSSSTSHANKPIMETTQNNTTPAAPRMTAEEISHRMLDLIGNLKTADDISAKNLETIFGLKVYQHAKKPNHYETGAKITETWSFSITVILGTKEGESNRLLFSFDDQTDSSASMTPICQVDFDAYLKRLTELGFASQPGYGEHGRQIYWRFSRDKLNFLMYIRGENSEKATHRCVSSIDLSI